MLEIRKTVTEIKSISDGLMSRLDRREARFSEFDDRSTKLPNQKLRGKKMKTGKNQNV